MRPRLSVRLSSLRCHIHENFSFLSSLLTVTYRSQRTALHITLPTDPRKMGGDDLGDYDDYLLAPVVADADSDDDSDDNIRSKRNLEETGKDEGDDKEPSSKKQKKLTNENVLIKAGCGIELSSVDDQLSFLKTSLKHYAMLAGTDEKDSVDESSFKLTSKSLLSSTKETLPERLRDVVSLKRLKKHREVCSPAVVIVCQSARRAVAVLKDLTDLRLRATKLFPKNGEVQQQVTQLRLNPFPLAVGTPHRLSALCREEKGLSFSHTQLVVLDCFVSKKQYTVCTLPDTAAETMGLLREHVIPEMKANKNLRIAFL